MKTPKSLLVDIAEDLVQEELNELVPEKRSAGFDPLARILHGEGPWTGEAGRARVSALLDELERLAPVAPIQELAALGRSPDVRVRHSALQSLRLACELLTSLSRWMATSSQPAALAAASANGGMDAPRYQWTEGHRELVIDRFTENGGQDFRYHISARFEEAERLQGVPCRLSGFGQSAIWNVVGASQIETDLVVPAGDHQDFLPERLSLNPDPELVQQLMELFKELLVDRDDMVADEAWKALQDLRGMNSCQT